MLNITEGFVTIVVFLVKAGLFILAILVVAFVIHVVVSLFEELFKK
ncbi:MAG: hypothetical protein NUV47_04020 [Patescibacteria group bacterium]|nr:hypothetical protein [Patescibacteria group bacterium]